MIAIDCGYLVRREIGSHMSEISAPNVISSLQYVLKDILHVAEKTGGNTFAADFIESLTACSYVFLNARIAFLGEHSGNVAGIGDTEAVCPRFAAHDSWIEALSIAYRAAHNVAIIPDNFKHCGFARANVTP